MSLFSTSIDPKITKLNKKFLEIEILMQNFRNGNAEKLKFLRFLCNSTIAALYNV